MNVQRMRRLVRRLGVPARDDSGFTLMEVMVAFGVFAVTSTALVSLLITSVSLTGANKQRVVATNLAAQEISFVKGLDETAPPLGVTTRTVNSNNNTYTLTRNVQWVKAGATASACTGGSAAANGLAYLRVDVTVSWANMRRIRPITMNTLIYPGPTVPTDRGTAWVQILDRAGNPSGGHVVTLTKSGSTYKQTTDGDGCVFFAFIPAGSYTASLSTPGYVDLSNNPSPSRGLSIVADAAPSTWTVTYDKAP